MNRPVCAALLALFAGFAAPPAAAQEDAKEIAGSYVGLAKPQLRRGGWFDAIANLKKALQADPKHEEAAVLLACAYRDTGEYDKAREALQPFTTARALTLRCELAFTRGDFPAAQDDAKKALEANPLALGALVVQARLHEAHGRRDEAIAAYEEINARWAKTDAEQETDEVLLAEARARLGIMRLSQEHAFDRNAVIDRVQAIVSRAKALESEGKEPPVPDLWAEALVELGDYYLADFKTDLDAKKWYSRVVERNAQYAPAQFGLARQMAFRYDDIEAAKLCEDVVLRANPNYAPALLYLAEMAMGDGELDKARGLVDRALAVNALEPRALAGRAAILYLRGDAAGFEREAAAILARDRFESAPYAVLASVLEEQRRFAEALAFAEKAVQTDALDWESHFVAGRNALNEGDDAKAEKYLRAAAKGDRLNNVYRDNFLKLFEAMRNFSHRKDAQFVVRIPPEEEEPYYRLLRKHMGQSIELLGKKWGFEPTHPLYISVFSKQEDFATRTIGLPGFPALGACFGRVVTLDSPRALPPGAFSWNATQHHELAHVITLQLSKGRVPRWLTEGASVYEERKVSRTWNRDDERDLVDAIASDEVLTLANINNAFRGPRVLYAYYQGGLMCEWIERDFGFPKLRELVRLYGEGLDDKAAVGRALGVEPKEFDARFLQFAKDYVKDLRVLRRPSKAKVDKLKRALKKTPDDVEAWFLVCEGAVARGDFAAALSALGNAAKLAPNDGRVPAMRAMVAWHEKKPAQAAQHAEDAIAKGVDVYELRMGLAEHYARGEKDMAKAKEHWRKAIEHFPLEKGGGDPRLALAHALGAEGEKNLDEVTALLRAHVDVDEDDVGTRRQLATIYAQHGKPDDELLMIEQLRDIVPLPNGGGMPAGLPGPGGAPPPGWDRDSAIWLHERLGEIYLERKRFEDAELAWSCAVGVSRMSLGPKGAPAADPQRVSELLARHAESLQLLGRKDEARSRAQEALRLDAENDLAKQVLDSLGS